LDPAARRLAEFEKQGVRGLTIHDVEGSAQHQAHVTRDANQTREAAFGDFTRRANYQATIAEAARRRATADRNTVAPKDRADAIRYADSAAADYLKSISGEYGILPDGVDPAAIRQQFKDEYLSALEGRRVLDVGALKRVMPQPTRTGRMTVEGLRPRGAGAVPGAQQPTSGDPYEQYLARTGR
jgi:hypothetical protein